MMLLLLILSLGIILCSGFYFSYQLFQLVQLDAAYRGMARPKLWSWISVVGQRGEGLILYLLKRRNYPRENMTDEDFLTFQNWKKRAKFSTICTLAGVALFLYTIIFLLN